MLCVVRLFLNSKHCISVFITIFSGVKALNSGQQANDTNEICYEKVLDFVRKGHQVMVFVHARNATVKTAMSLLETASNRGKTEEFLPNDSPQYGVAQKSISKSRNKQLVELFNGGFGIHHAGMLRSDRSLVEKLFGQGFIKVSKLISQLSLCKIIYVL